jgi:hypothetical protein
MRDKIRVLFLAADPFGEKAPLELGDEMRAIDHAIQQGSARDALELVSHFATRTRDLQRALLRHRPQVVHFAGHGDRPGVICLEDEFGERRKVDGAALAALFRALDGGVRVVVLNGCHTLPVAAALTRVVDYAIGTRDRIRDETAIAFAEAFYTALAFGKDVRQAFDLAVSQLRVEGNDQADLPALRVRRGAAPGPLLPDPAGRAEAGAGHGVEVDQEAEVGDLQADRVNLIGDDEGGPLASGARISQKFRGESVTAGELNIIGVRRTRD